MNGKLALTVAAFVLLAAGLCALMIGNRRAGAHKDKADKKDVYTVWAGSGMMAAAALILLCLQNS